MSEKLTVEFAKIDGVKYVNYQSLIIYLLKCGYHELVKSLESGEVKK